MAWLSENNVDANQAEKLQKYQQLAFEIRERERERGRGRGRGRTRIQCNDNPNRYWLLRWRHETSDKLNWMTDIRQEENKSNIERNGEGSAI